MKSLTSIYWDTTGTVKDDNVTLPGATFFQGFSGNDIITSNGQNNVILPGSGNNTVNINSNNDQILINRHPLNHDTINISESGHHLTVVLDGSIRLRDLGFAFDGNNLVLKVGNGGNLSTATQTIVINNAKNNLLLQFGTGFTLDLTKFNLTEVHQGDNEDNTQTATGAAILSGSFGNNTLNGGATGPSIFIGGAGNDMINGSQDNSGDLYILEDRGGFERITGLDGTSIVSNKTVLIVSTNAEFLGSAVLKRDEIWFATKETVNKLPENFDREKLPNELNELEDGELLIWIRGQNNGAIIKDWDKWDETNRVVVTNQYEGAFEIKKEGINTLLEIMDKYQDLENKIYKPWHPDLNDEDATLNLNEELSNAILESSWQPTSSIISVA
ncbi:hypothetical protein ACP6PL_02410 [Dapis sp. BLCC M126]|uniref:hypothetical protein n=1 Tax=Dapis sp. BLCC M126 TaxID=3400189 RepID=UPI003CF4D3EF